MTNHNFYNPNLYSAMDGVEDLLRGYNNGLVQARAVMDEWAAEKQQEMNMQHVHNRIDIAHQRIDQANSEFSRLINHINSEAATQAKHNQSTDQRIEKLHNLFSELFVKASIMQSEINSIKNKLH